ncbi:hypothetical protein OROHE_014620 [Orobanche hederae]
MSRIRRRFEIIERSPSHYLKQTPTTLKPPRTLMMNPCFTSFPVFEEELDCTLDLLNLAPSPPSSLDYFDTITDLIQIVETPFRASTRLAARRVGLTDLYLQTLTDRVSDLEMGFDRLVREEKIRRDKKFGERKYTWTAEVKIPENDRKYRWTAEIKDWKDEKKGLEKSNKLTTEIKRKGAENFPINQTYTIKVCSREEKKKKQYEKVKGNGKTVGSTARTIEIQEPHDDGGIVLKQVFDKRVERRRGKRKELSPQDAAALIQNSFRAYLTRRSQALRALRDLAIAKTKLKEIRALFNNFSYRRRIASDAVEHQRFSEKIIVLLLTVDAIEGADLMVRGAKRSMVDELEAMLDAVDPQKPMGKSLSMRRRTFDMPDGVISKELAAGVEQVVQMLEREADGSESFEACL